MPANPPVACVRCGDTLMSLSPLCYACTQKEQILDAAADRDEMLARHAARLLHRADPLALPDLEQTLRPILARLAAMERQLHAVEKWCQELGQRVATNPEQLRVVEKILTELTGRVNLLDGVRKQEIHHLLVRVEALEQPKKRGGS